MNSITNWLTECSNCFQSSNKNSLEILSDYNLNIHNLAKNCLHILNKNDLICEKCFLQFFLYDRFIIRQLFLYLKQEEQQQIDFIHINQLNLFAKTILNWNEYLNHIDFILQLFHIIKIKNFNQNSIYQLINDAFFFTTIQANIKIDHNQIFLQNFVNYLNQLNTKEDYKIYFNLIKRIIPWGFISIHKWLKICFLNTKINIKNENLKEFNSYNLSLTFLWYITNWLCFNKIFFNEYNPINILEKISQKDFIRNLYDSDKDGFSIVTLCQNIYYIDGPFLFLFYCNEEKIFSILLDEKLMDSAKACGGRSSLCLQLSPRFLILERGPKLLYWNIKKRSDGPLAIRIGHNGLTRVSIDLNMEYIHYPEGSSQINRIEIYKLGPYKTPQITPILRKKSQHNEYNLFSVDAHKLAESIGIHLFT